MSERDMGQEQPVPDDQPATGGSGRPPASTAGEAAGEPASTPPAGGPGRPSGLRNPERAIRGLGAGTLILETVALLLAIQPIRLLGGELSGAAIGVIVALAVLATVLAGRLGRPWAWWAATALQFLLLLSGFLHWSLGALGFLFGLVWVYILQLRRHILG